MYFFFWCIIKKLDYENLFLRKIIVYRPQQKSCILEGILYEVLDDLLEKIEINEYKSSMYFYWLKTSKKVLDWLFLCI